MDGSTIKTLAEYIAKLHKNDQNLLNPEQYRNDPIDTNGVEQDHIETFWPPESK